MKKWAETISVFFIIFASVVMIFTGFEVYQNYREFDGTCRTGDFFITTGNEPCSFLRYNEGQMAFFGLGILAYSPVILGGALVGSLVFHCIRNKTNQNLK